jgi:cephalosporin hydroxylase
MKESILDNIANDRKTVDAMAADERLKGIRIALYEDFIKYRYSYNFTWYGRPVIQYPDDMMAMQEILFAVQPDLIVETGVAHGGSLIFYASLCQLMGKGEILGIDIDIRAHNRAAIEAHPMQGRITLLNASSTSDAAVAKAREMARGKKKVMVVLDSNHTHEHVREELRLYSDLVGAGSYLVVCDTAIEYCAESNWEGRPWGKGNNPKTALDEFLRENARFEVDADLEKTLLFTASPGGYLKCLRDVA